MKAGQKTSTGLVWVIFIFSVLSVFLLAAAWYGAGIVPDLMTRNYRSIQYASQMEGALIDIFLAEIDGKPRPAPAVAQFERAVKLEGENLTEENEELLVKQLAHAWEDFRDRPVSPAIESFQKLRSGIDKIVEVNEQAMVRLTKRAVSLRYGALFGGIIGFLLVLMYSGEILLYLATNREPQS